ncbi:MAG TPA: tyrosine-protein phosphatase, partial [Thermodesulfobacteriota bacterium]|nr:tyrosine-protein phosphatase [Thermodesulfobacteriota bacterium]
TIINLRSFHSDKAEVMKLGISYEQIYMKAWHAEREDVVRFLRIATDPSRLPILVHCEHGSDRTGLVVAIYRVTATGWTKEQAIREMVEGGYGFHSIWENLVHFIRNLDVDTIRKEAGIMNQTSGAFAPMPQISPGSN